MRSYWVSECTVVFLLPQTTAQDHVYILIVSTACPLLLWLETWSGWPLSESQDRTVSACLYCRVIEWGEASVQWVRWSVRPHCPHAILNLQGIFFNLWRGEHWISLEPFPLIAAFFKPFPLIAAHMYYIMSYSLSLSKLSLSKPEVNIHIGIPTFI